MSKYERTTAPLSAVERAQLSELVAELGEAAAMRRLGLSRIAIARGVAGFALHPGSRRMIQAGLRIDSRG